MGVAPRFFSCKSARSKSLLWAIIAIMMIDLASIDLFLSRKNAILMAVFTVMNLAAIVWFIREYIALGASGVAIERNSVRFVVGTLYKFSVSSTNIESTVKPTWKDIPQPGFPEAKDFLLLTKQAQSNVLFKLRNEIEIPLPLGKKRGVKRIAIHLDEPDSFMSAFNNG